MFSSVRLDCFFFLNGTSMIAAYIVQMLPSWIGLIEVTAMYSGGQVEREA